MQTLGWWRRKRTESELVLGSGSARFCGFAKTPESRAVGRAPPRVFLVPTGGLPARSLMQPRVKLLNVLVHMVTETNRHLRHADILREQPDGALDSDPTTPSARDDAEWATHRTTVERAALRAT